MIGFDFDWDSRKIILLIPLIEIINICILAIICFMNNTINKEKRITKKYKIYFAFKNFQNRNSPSQKITQTKVLFFLNKIVNLT